MLAQDKPQYVRCKTFLGDVDVMRAWYVRQDFGRHYHEGFGIGAITAGAMEFYYRGESLIASRGVVNSVNPDEPHDGHSFADEGWRYSMLYFAEDVFRNLYGDMTGRYKTPFLTSGVINDIYLARGIAELVETVLSGGDMLDAESRLTGVLSSAVIRHSDKKPSEIKRYKLGSKLSRVKEYINENLDRPVRINDLAAVAGVSPFHFIRSFRVDTGVAPYEYAAQKRAEKAKNFILKGLKPAEVSAVCGYSDQSHMNRWLKKIFGITPSNMSSIVL